MAESQTTQSFDVVVEFYGYKATSVDAESAEDAGEKAVSEILEEYPELEDAPINVYPDEIV